MVLAQEFKSDHCKWRVLESSFAAVFIANYARLVAEQVPLPQCRIDAEISVPARLFLN